MISFLTSADAISDNYEANESNKDSSKLRTIFSWFNKKQSGDQLRLEHAKAQQAILPYALGYRGDFLFWWKKNISLLQNLKKKYFTLHCKNT